MSDAANDVQFERAEPSAPAQARQARCGCCGDALSSYFEANGNAVCEPCKDKLVAAQRGSHIPTLLRGGAFGFVAAALGAAAYYAIAELTGYEFGLMSIVLGLAVGFAVRAGARGRGGWRYQALAMFLCYAAISGTYVPRVLSAVKANQTAEAKASTPAQPVVAAATPAAPAEPAVPREKPSVGGFFQALGLLFLFALAIPFLAGVDNLMGLVIIGIGLYEAWKVNRGAPFSVTGPFTVGQPRGV